MSGKPRDQHFLPKMFLRGFCNSDRHIYMFDSQKEAISNPRNPKSVAFQKHMYTILGGQTKNFIVEETFSKIEGRATSLFKEILENNFSKLSDKEKLLLIDFLVVTFIRSPDYVETAEVVLRDPAVQQKLKKKNPKTIRITTIKKTIIKEDLLT